MFTLRENETSDRSARLPWVAGVLALLGLAAPTAQAARNHALLIGISDYASSHPQKIESDLPFSDLDCAADVRQIEAALVHTFHFRPGPAAGEIVTRTTHAQTTRAAILAALQRLVDATGPGDVVYIHYSGHGDQLRDPTEPTGLDSAIVPCDYREPPPDAKTEATTNEISGRTLLRYVRALQAKHPAQIALSFDSCHSASAVRGAAPAARRRGLTFGEYVAWYKRHVDPRYAPRSQGRPVARGAGETAQPGQEDLTGAGYVVISACRNTDRAWETDGTPAMGRLSECLARALMAATPQTTYRQVFDQVYAQFHQKYPDQHPQLDGSDPDAPLLGGQAVAAPPSYLVLVDSPGHYTLDAGGLLGMTVGSVFAIYGRDDTRLAPGTEIARARITAVSTTTSTLELTNRRAGLGPNDLSAARAVETAHDYAAPPLSLDAGSLRRALPGRADAILARLQDPVRGLRMVGTAPPPAGRGYDVAAAGGALVRVAGGTPLLALDPAAGDLPQRVYAALQREARYRYACGLGVGQAGLNPALRIALRVVPTDAAGTPLPAPAAPPPDADRRLALPLGGHFVVQVQNRGRRPLHLAVLDLESSGAITPRWPLAGSTAQDNVITPTTGDTWTTLWVGADTTQRAVYHATSADPDEMFKAIATRAGTREGDPDDEYVDFTPLTTRGGTRGPRGPLSDLFGPAVDEGRRGTALKTPVDARTWTAATIPFRVN